MPPELELHLILDNDAHTRRLRSSAAQTRSGNELPTENADFLAMIVGQTKGNVFACHPECFVKVAKPQFTRDLEAPPFGNGDVIPDP